jgi:hypothetical protein
MSQYLYTNILLWIAYRTTCRSLGLYLAYKYEMRYHVTKHFGARYPYIKLIFITSTPPIHLHGMMIKCAFVMDTQC